MNSQMLAKKINRQDIQRTSLIECPIHPSVICLLKCKQHSTEGLLRGITSHRAFYKANRKSQHTRYMMTQTRGKEEKQLKGELLHTALFVGRRVISPKGSRSFIRQEVSSLLAGR